MKKFAFIGAGNMGGALIKGVVKAINPADVFIFEPDMAKAEKLSAGTGCTVAVTARAAVAAADYVVLAVKPQILPRVLADLKDSIDREKQTLVSIAAGISLSTLAEIAGDMPVIRVMPNTPSEIGEGMNIYAVNSLVTQENKTAFEAMFAKCGIMEYVSEGMIDIATAVTGCTPAFAYMFIEALADGAVRCGVPREQAIRYAAQAVKGSAAMVLESGRHPDELKDAVCSPGGSTIVGVATLEDHSFRAAAANAVYNANLKNIEFGKK